MGSLDTWLLPPQLGILGHHLRKQRELYGCPGGRIAPVRWAGRRAGAGGPGRCQLSAFRLLMPCLSPFRPWAPPQGRASPNGGTSRRGLPLMGVGHSWASTSLRVLPTEPPGWEGAGGSAHTPNPAFFLLPHHPPTPCMMAKAILPLPLPLLLLPVWGGGR